MTLLEVMIAAIILIIVFLGLAQFYWRGRRQIDYEEDRRKATAVVQARFDGLRRDYHFDHLSSLNNTDTTYVVDNRSFRIHHTVTANAPETNATTVRLDVTWVAKVGGSNVNRTMQATTILGRGLP
jgi:Tfp pilus assembly protein PilV